MALSAGSRLGPYEILAPLGAGGMGEVYRARDPRIGREVAIKVLPPAFAADAERLRRFEQEVRTAGALNHPNILIIFDVGTHEGSPYIVSELLAGETLRQCLSHGALAQRRAIDYALGIGSGLAAAHDKGIIHRDLKPENLFITKDGRVKILDFGLAKLTEHEPPADVPSEAPTLAAATEPGVILGTVGYMSPEQVRGQRTDHRSDLFVFGVILYEMLSGRRAFRGETAAETMTAILKEDPPELSASGPSIAPGLGRVVRHCLEKVPEQRFQSARDLTFALEALSGVPGPATGSMVPVTERRRRVVPWQVVAAAAAVGVVAVSSFLAGGRAAKAPQPSFHRLTFRRGPIRSARFAPDGQTILYGAAWDGTAIRLYSTRPEGPESRPLGLPDADILSVSRSGEMAISLHRRFQGHIGQGTLASVLLAGTAPREILENVQEADWSPVSGPDGSQLAVVRRVKGRHRLEFPIGRVLYETGGWITHPRVSPDGKQVAFLDHTAYGDDRGSVGVVNLAGDKRTVAQGGASTQGLAWSPSGEEIWFSAAVSGSDRVLYAVPVSGGKTRLVFRMAGAMTLQDISRDGRVLVSHDQLQKQALCLPPGEMRERDLSWFDWSFASDLSADGKTLLISEQGEAGGAHYSTYIRKTDGSPGIRIGEGFSQTLSADGKWALSILVHTTPAQLVLLPTGAGETRPLSYGSFDYGTFDYQGATWFPDGKRILVEAGEPGKGARLYVQDLAGGKPRPVAPEGFTGWAISTDGRFVACRNPDGKVFICPVEGGEMRAVAGLDDGDWPIRWSGDDHFLFVFRRGDLPANVYRLNLSTGRKELWKQIMPSDPTGVTGITRVLLTPDGKSYAYDFQRFLSDLYLVEGLK